MLLSNRTKIKFTKNSVAQGKKEGFHKIVKAFNLLVAGAGFEPTTFRL